MLLHQKGLNTVFNPYTLRHWAWDLLHKIDHLEQQEGDDNSSTSAMQVTGICDVAERLPFDAE